MEMLDKIFTLLFSDEVKEQKLQGLLESVRVAYTKLKEANGII